MAKRTTITDAAALAAAVAGRAPEAVRQAVKQGSTAG